MRFCRKSAIFRVWHGSCEASATGYQRFSGVRIMANRFEAIAFAVGFIATGFLALVALPLA